MTREELQLAIGDVIASGFAGIVAGIGDVWAVNLQSDKVAGMVLNAIEALGIPLTDLVSGKAVVVPVRLTNEMVRAWTSAEDDPVFEWRAMCTASPYARPAGENKA